MEGNRNGKKMSILMLPWLAHGHVFPAFELAKLLVAKNFHIFFCSTSIILNSIKPKLTQNSLSSHIALVELNLPTSSELPPHRHTTAGLPPHLMFSLKRAFDSAASAFDTILRNLNPNLVIYDFLQPWAPAVAQSADIPAVMFQPTGALMAAMVMYELKFSNSDFGSNFPEIRLSKQEIKQLKNMFRSSVNDEKDRERIMECTQRSRGIILIKSFREIEAKYIDLLSFLLGKKVIPVGPLVQEPENDVASARSLEKWLNEKEESSSILVSFGSEFYLSKEEIEEIAYGLELSQVNFIWILRFPATDGGGERKKVAEEELPKGFLERVKERGMVVEGWAPQVMILKHRSTGGFLSHCGWSSVMESFNFGVPIIAAPMQLDQPLNARLVERLGVGVVVERDEDDGRLRRGEVARVIKEVMIEKNGERVRKKVKEFAEMMKKKDNEEMVVVVEELTKLCTTKKKELKDHLQSNYYSKSAIDDRHYEVVKVDDDDDVETSDQIMESFCKYNN